MRVLVLNGPNLGLLGRREPDVYGSQSLEDIVALLTARATELGVELDAFQSDEEGALVSRIGQSEGQYDGIIFNPAAYTHTSLALRDALQASTVPCVEVHLSNTLARESFRHESLTGAACIGQIMGFGARSYLLALQALVEVLGAKNTADGKETGQ